MASKPLTLDSARSSVSFSVKKLGILTVKGSLTGLSGQLSFAQDALERAYFNVCARPETIDTGTPKRDAHLKSADFFDVETFPEIRFESTAVQRVGDAFAAKGNLTLLRSTHEVSIPFQFRENTFTGSFSLHRLDYQLGKKFPAFFIGKTIHITINCKLA